METPHRQHLNKDIWEKIYENGHEERAPWDEVVSFVYSHKPPKPNDEIRILEVGCGVGNNVNFLSLQGFRASGIDFSPSAIAKARASASQHSQFEIGDFRQLPYAPESFDMVIDRAALWYTTTIGIHEAIEEIHRVLKPGGKFYFTPCKENIIKKTGQIHFIHEKEIEWYLDSAKWNILSLRRIDLLDLMDDKMIVSHYRIVAEKR